MGRLANVITASIYIPVHLLPALFLTARLYAYRCDVSLPIWYLIDVETVCSLSHH